MPTEITFIFVKFEGCVLSGIGARSIPVIVQPGMYFQNIKTHGSESRGQEEAACATTTVSILHVAPL